MEDTPEVSVFVYEQNGTPTGITSLEITDSTVAGRALLTAADATEQRADLGLGSAALSSASDFATTSHTHIIANVTGLQTALDGKAATAHTHVIANVTGLQTALDGKAALVHSHVIADTTGLQTALDGKAATSHTHTIANVTGLQTALDGKIDIPASSAQGDILYRGASAWERLAAGTSGQVLYTNGAGSNPSWGSAASINLGTAINSTSGTAIDFTGIPSGVNIVRVLLSGVSTNGTTEVTVRLGTSDGIEATGYSGGFGGGSTGSFVTVNLSTGFNVGGNSAADTRHVVINLFRVSGNTWISQAIIGKSNVATVDFQAGSKTLSGVLDRIRVTTGNGTNLFDAGTINIAWEF